MSKLLNIQPIALTASVANLLNPNVSSLSGPVGFTLTQPYIRITRIRAVSKSAAVVTVSLYKGATGGSAAGTEVVWNAAQVPANGNLEEYCDIRLDAADFLTGVCSAATSVTLNIDAEIDIS